MFSCFEGRLVTPVTVDKGITSDGEQVTVTVASRGRRFHTLSILSMLAVLSVPNASPAWNHTEIEWRTLTTDHFEIHYHPGEEWSAEQAARVAEEIYGPLTAFYACEPDSRVHINLFDKSDQAEGATYYYLNRIDISASDIEFHLRGTANWLRNVITHEFTHMVSIQSSMKMPRRFPALYFQMISFEREKRPDVITGYPNFQMSVPVAGEIVPNWFAEGTAQFQCGVARNDFWDSHRDMLLRVAALNGRLLSMDEMGVFGKNSLQAEMVYNQGFSMVLFLARRFGPEKLAALMDALSGLRHWTFNGACKCVLGVSGDCLYRLWSEDVTKHYGAIAESIERESREGERIAGKGFMNLFPVRETGRDGILCLSNRGGDYMDLYLVRCTPGGKVETLDGGITSRFDISPDGRGICYSKRTKKNRYGYAINDIFVYRLETGRSTRLTHGLRGLDPAWSPDGRRIACVVSVDGADRVSIVDVESGVGAALTAGVPGRQYFGISWGERGILTSRFDGVSRDIVLIDPATGDETVVLDGLADERDPVWIEGETGFFYASDRAGIFNIYYREIERGTDVMVTNTIGGAFNPSGGDGEECLFSAFGPGGYEIRRITGWRAAAVAVDAGDDDRAIMDGRRTCIGHGIESRMPAAPEESETAGGIGQHIREQIESGGENFGISYTSLFLFPTVQIYDGHPRIGLSLDSRDMLDRQSVFASGTIALENTEFDLYLGFETRQFKPTFSLDLFRSRKFYSYITEIGGRTVDFYTRYDLWDAFFTCRFELRPPTPFNRSEIAIRYNHGEYGLNIEALDVFGEEVGWTYYKGDEISLIFNYRKIRPEIDADINPRSGRDISLEVTRAYNKLSSGDFEYRFMPIYGENFYGRYFLQYEEYVPLPFWRHALSLYVKGGALDNTNIDDFFYLYLGSRDGLRGYSYYSMGGTKMAMARVTYRFPFLRRINNQIFHVYLQSLYLGLFAEAGKAWNEEEVDLRGNKKDVGFEIRMKGFTFYSYPLAVSFEAAYGLNDVQYTDPFNREMTFYEGKDWKFYGSVLFSF